MQRDCDPVMNIDVDRPLGPSSSWDEMDLARFMRSEEGDSPGATPSQTLLQDQPRPGPTINDSLDTVGLVMPAVIYGVSVVVVGWILFTTRPLRPDP